ncbi:stage V sporulation protein AD [Bacillus sp. HMF5848]|uniref:stage V sporulation protein AD n=1 Tax=Bacillus sp. HMF5848 TaxID=2495421 RepID=UPI000F76BA77|nr:stage V sporulation protein AD [Bacillus sp. HMF5848]RSK27704.1 stage V sporulation protein AD [Bacillus sp. HMF5848]
MVNNTKHTWRFKNPVYLHAAATVTGPKEKQGPLGKMFDKSYSDMYCDEETFEKAERRLLSDSIQIVCKKNNTSINNIDLLLAGDLTPQLASSHYTAYKLPVSFLGMYSACATLTSIIATASALISGSFISNAITAVSSHKRTADKYFRNPTQLGQQIPDTATYTVTGAGAAFLSNKPSLITVTAATIGKVINTEMNDPFNMGEAMAIAASSTISQHLHDMKETVKDYDLIITGDLSTYGNKLVQILLNKEGIDLGSSYNDCGLMIFEPNQDVFAGGSGAACCALVTFTYVIHELLQKRLKRVLLVATGALHSPSMLEQGDFIPVIAHGVVLEANEG